MDSEDDTKDDVDSGNESSGDDVDFAMDVETHNTRERQTELEEYPYEVLSTEEIVQHMVDCIKEVNTVVEVSVLVVNNGHLNEVTLTFYTFSLCLAPLISCLLTLKVDVLGGSVKNLIGKQCYVVFMLYCLHT